LAPSSWKLFGTNSEFKNQQKGMKTFVRVLSACALLGTTAAQAQTFTSGDVLFWVGSGPDSTVLVVDFQDGTDDPSYAWGFLHDGTATAEDMLNAIADADPNTGGAINGGFLSDLTYNGHAGIGGQPNWWSTWSGPSFGEMETNMGLAEVLSNGSWFGCSYTDFDPALAPTTPIAAMNPLAFTADDVQFWTGEGDHSAVLVVDFQDGSGTSSYAWGFRFNATTTGEDMLNAVAAADPQFGMVVNTGFLSDITYNNHAGIGGEPNWWSTWSGTNLGNWVSNLGISTEVGDGGFFGCSYTDFNPALRPGTPVAAGIPTGIREVVEAQVSAWPIPATDVLHVSTDRDGQQELGLYDLAGQRVHSGVVNGPVTTMDVRMLPAGIYVLQVGDVRQPLIIQ